MRCSIVFVNGNSPLLSKQHIRPWFLPCIYNTRVLSGLSQTRKRLRRGVRIIDRFDDGIPPAYRAGFRMQYRAAKRAPAHKL